MPFAKVNCGNGEWSIRVEDHDVTATPEEWRAVHGSALRLRSLGIPAEAVLAGEPANVNDMETLRIWTKEQGTLRRYIATPLLDLALWTITNQTIKEQK